MTIRRLASIKTAEEFKKYLSDNNITLPFTEKGSSGKSAMLNSPYQSDGKTIGSRFCILPMEGWDGTLDGHPTDLVRRRWANFGRSGAKLIWGGEAAAVRMDGRANPHQLLINEDTLGEIADLRELLVDTHAESFGNTDDLLVGLQLTHSGRFSCPHDVKKREPVILYHHPLLDKKFGIPEDYPVMTDDEILKLEQDYIHAAGLAQKAGFDFVDVKHCHGYLGHEFLSAVDRPGRFGGSFDNRTRFLSDVVQGIRAHAPGLGIGVRLSAFDFIPFEKGADGTGQPVKYNQANYPYAFGGDGTGTGLDLTEPVLFLKKLWTLGVKLVCITAGSPYYVPHIQRPALFPPVDAYQPPEDPLVGVARLISATSALKRAVPELTVVGSGYSYLQEWLPNVAEAVIANGDADFVGYGRMVLSYPDFAADVLNGRVLKKNKICRTFSDCTTAPRLGLVSGCFPLDEYYRSLPDYECLACARKQTKKS
jgi:2,4-dienoyl-CoA reductase-like NADH-dependent reductase (Old Yellow Enzyme family)